MGQQYVAFPQIIIQYKRLFRTNTSGTLKIPHVSFLVLDNVRYFLLLFAITNIFRASIAVTILAL
jgi:hypothetical protein